MQSHPPATRLTNDLRRLWACGAVREVAFTVVGIAELQRAQFEGEWRKWDDAADEDARRLISAFVIR